MRVVLAFLLTFVSFVVADLPAIQLAVGDVNAAIINLNSAISGVNVAADATGVAAPASAMQSAINEAAKAFKANPALTAADAVALQSSVTAMVIGAGAALDNLVTKAGVIKQGGQTAATLKALQGTKTAAQELATALVQKVPSAAQGLAQQATSEVGKIIDKAITAFSK